MSKPNVEKLRRDFLKFLAASPAVAAFGGISAFLQTEGLAQEVRQSTFADNARDRRTVVDDPKDALTVFDFEETARRTVQDGHWAYMASGTDDDATLYANRAAYRQVQLRPRRLRDATKVDMRTELFGERYASPIFTCPTGGERSFHTDGEVAVARATKARGTMQMLSTSTSIAVETVNNEHGQPVWYQLYAPPDWEVCAQLLTRVRGVHRVSDCAHGRQYDRALRRDFPPRASEGPQAMRGVPRRRHRSAPPADVRRHRS